MEENNIFRALKHRNYRLYFLGQSISLIGTWMQRMAVSWLIYRTTHSVFMLGVSSFAGQVPTFIFSPYAGVITDRYNRYKILLTTQVFSMVQATVLAISVLTDNYSVYLIIFLSFLLGTINAFDTPSRQALINQLVSDKEDLPNAIALNSSMMNLARLIGPSVAGLLLMSIGEGYCFLLNAISFIAVLISLLLIRVEENKTSKPEKNFIRDFKEGYRYLNDSPNLKSTIVMIGIMGFLVMPYNTLIPVFAKDIFNGNASTFGWLNSMAGLGALSGAFYIASYGSRVNLKKILFFFTVILGISLILFSMNRIFTLAMVLAMTAGLGMMTQFTISNTLIQTTVKDEMRGRVTSFYIMAVMGMQPFGSFFIGAIAHLIGTPLTVLFQGISCLIVAFFYYGYLKRNNLLLNFPNLSNNKDNESVISK